MTLKEEILLDLPQMEAELGNPVFTWKGNKYGCTASMADNELQLDIGGFTPQKVLNLTIPRYDTKGNATFPNDISPQSQQLVTYLSEQFRIRIAKVHPTNAYIRLICVSDVRGL